MPSLFETLVGQFAFHPLPLRSGEHESGGVNKEFLGRWEEWRGKLRSEGGVEESCRVGGGRVRRAIMVILCKIVEGWRDNWK